MNSWKTTVSGAGVLACQLAACFLPPEWAGKCMQAGAILAAFGLMAARDNNVTSEQAGARTDNTIGQAVAGKVVVWVIGLVVCLGLSGCSTSGLAKVVRELAKDPATASMRLRVGTPYGNQELDWVRVGSTNSATRTADGALVVNGR